VRDRVEHWGDLTAEPGGVDYIEIEVAGLPALWAVPKESAEDRVVLSFHGGGFVSGSIYTHRKLFGHLAKAIGARALITDYRGTPVHSHPVPLEDTTAAYRWLLDQGIDAKHVAVAGDSSGGGLAISTMLRARELDLPTAAALMLMSPWVDMTVSADTYESNRETEAFFYQEVVAALAAMYLAGGDPKDPLASPLHADLAGSTSSPSSSTPSRWRQAARPRPTTQSAGSPRGCDPSSASTMPPTRPAPSEASQSRSIDEPRCCGRASVGPQPATARLVDA